MNPLIHLENLYSRRAMNLPETPDEPDLADAVIDFTFGHPDPSLFPAQELLSATSSLLKSSADTALQYSNFRGSDVLLDALVSYLTRKLNSQLDYQNIIVTNGSMQVISLMARVFINPGDYVLTEAPTYFRAVTIFSNHESIIKDIPLDKNGLRIDALREELETLKRSNITPKVFYTVPTHQNPSGFTLSLERRKQLLELSTTYGFIILEDTAYDDLWYDNPPPPSLFELDSGQGRVVQMGTFSKLMAPGLAIGWALGPKPVINRFVEFKENGGTTPLTAHIAAAFLNSDNFTNHVDKLRKIYRAKRDIAILTANDQLKDFAEWEIPAGGYFLWLKLHDEITLSSLWENSLREKVVFLPGKYCFAGIIPMEKNRIRLAFSCLGLSQIEEGIKRLGIAIRNA